MEKLEFSVQSENSEYTAYLVDMHACKCSCAVGFNGKHCKHQGSVLKQYNFLTAFNTLCNATKLELYKVASGKSANDNIFKSLLIIEETQEANKLRETNNTQGTSSVEMEIDESVVTSKLLTDWPKHDVNDIKRRYLEHTNAIIKYLEDDPENFAPALDTYLGNFEKYVGSKTTLISGLCTAFKWKGIPTKKGSKNKCRRRGKCITVQPTSVARRCGIKKNIGRAPTGVKIIKPKAPHCLKTCVTKNIALGSNKSKK